MSLRESIFQAIATIRAHKLRSFLTLLGVIIGVTAIIGMTSIITGVQIEMERQMSILQSAVFQVQKWPMVVSFGPNDRERGERPDIRAWYADVIRDRCPAVKLVGPEVWQFGVSVRHGDRVTRPVYTLAGGTPEFFSNNGYFIGEGRAIAPVDVDFNKQVAVLGTDIVEEIFPFEDPIGREIKISFRVVFDDEDDEFVAGGKNDYQFTHKFTVIGVLEERGEMMGSNKDDRVVIPFTTFEKLYGKGRSINITVQADDADLFRTAQEQVVGAMRSVRHLRPGDDNNFALFSSEMAIDAFNQTTGSIKVAAVGICAISLLVAGIGIMNIMLVSVSERTREIGVRKALGARSRDILRQFIVEAIVLCEIGGVIGVVVGLGLAAGLSAVIPALKAAVPLWAVVLGLTFCSLVGLFFGIYPASRASRLDPIIALHHE